MAMDGSANPEDFVVGCLLSIKTTLGDEFEGQVITFDRFSNILVLHILPPTLIMFFFANPRKQNKNKILRFTVILFCSSLTFVGCEQEGSKQGPRRNIRLLKANYIKEWSLLGQAEDPLDIKKCYLDLNSLQAREDSAIRWVFF